MPPKKDVAEYPPLDYTPNYGVIERLIDKRWKPAFDLFEKTLKGLEDSSSYEGEYQLKVELAGQLIALEGVFVRSPLYTSALHC